MADVKVRVELNKNNFKDFDKYNGLKKVESLSQSSPGAGSIHYGVLENSGSVEIVDENGKIYEMLTKGEMDNSNTNISVIANGNVVQSHIGVDSNYSRNEKLLTIDLGNRIKDLDTLVYKGYPYPDKSENLASLLFDVLKTLRYTLFGTDKELTQDEFVGMLSDKYDDNQTLYEYLENTIIDYPYIEAGNTYREVIDYFCNVAQMQMFINDNGNFKFVSARPKAFNKLDKAIYIPKKNMFSKLDYNVIVKNKYDGVSIQKNQPIDEHIGNTSVYSSDTIDLSGFTLNDFPYIQNNELYVREKTDDYSLNYNYNYGTKVKDLVTSIYSANYIMSKYYYKNFTFIVPKKSSDNLQQTTSIKPYLITEDSKSYSLIYEKTTGTCSGSYNKNSHKFTSLERSFSITPEDKTYKVEEGSGSLNGSISKVSVNELIEIPDDDDSKVIQVTEITPYYYQVTVKVLISLEKINIWYMNPSTTSSSGTFEKYMPKSLTVSIYGSQRTIKFENVDASTNDIQNSKTTVSLNTNNLFQKDEIINAVKSNILMDYMSGISNGTVTISCNDYYNKLNQKVVDWNKGEIVKVNDLVCFENDKYIDGNQKYWKIKGRTFRKEGVPMVDLELEEAYETSQLTLENYSWDVIKIISESGKAKEVFSVGDEKTVTLSNGEKITLQIAGFDYKEDFSAASDILPDIHGIVFVTKNAISGDYQMHSGITGDWETCDMRTKTLANVFNMLPNELQKNISTVANSVSTGTGYRFVDDNLWLLDYSDVFDERYILPLFKNPSNVAKGYDWWLRPNDYTINNVYMVNSNGTYQYAISSDYHKVIFAFCI